MPEESALKLKQGMIDELGSMLSKKLSRQIEQRKEIEERWLTDLRQYHGKYPLKVQEVLDQQNNETGSSNIFVNITRPKCDSAEARLSDMLFPTDDRNWGIQPTPDPELSQFTNDEELGDVAQAELEQSKDAAEAMEREIEDQLNEAHYSGIARDVIRDSIRLGTGIIKGPIVVGRTRKAWQPLADGVQQLTVKVDSRPTVKRVAPWDFYPDMQANDVDEAEFFFERDYLTRRKLSELGKKKDGFYLDKQIKQLLEDNPDSQGHHKSQDIGQRLREISGVNAVSTAGRFERWTFTGVIDNEFFDDKSILPKRMQDSPFEAMNVHIEFINDVVIKAVRMPLETDELLYSVYNWIEAEGSIFGYGVPYVMRASQEVVNKSWRTMLDNAALSVGPQVVVDQKIVEPLDGQWSLTPRKTWLKKDSNKSINEAFRTFDISSFQPELKDIFMTGRELANVETGIVDAQDLDVNSAQVETATATSIKKNEAGVIQRRNVKNWDDGITKPLIRRFYDYNMQYNPKPEIKGDMEVDARGASTLMVKETQTAALFGIMNFADSPVFGPLIKPANLFRKAVEAQRISPDEVLKTDEEIQQEQQQAEPQPTQDELELQFEQQKHADDMALKQAEMQQQRELKLIELAQNGQIRSDEVDAKLLATSEQEETKRAEQDLKLITGSGI